MVRPNEMDRIAEERARQEHSEREKARQADLEASRRTIRKLTDRAQAAIPRALENLAAKGYPGLEQVEINVPTQRILSRTTRHKKQRFGAYRTVQFDYSESSYRGAGSDPIWLLSDGRLGVYVVYTVPEFAAQVMQMAGVVPPPRPGWHVSLSAFAMSTFSSLVDWLDIAAGRGDTG